MADLRPFQALRYRPGIDLGAALSPPYDVIDASEQAALYERSPYNVVRLELSEERPGDGPDDNRYTRAASALREWRSAGLLARDEQPAFYTYVQEFEHEGPRRRTALFAALRLEPWETGTVRPHEETGRAAKEDRLQLIRHLRAKVSPLLLVYHDAKGAVRRLLEPPAVPVVQAATPDGQRHTLSAITNPATIEALSTALRDTPLYMADGHHRYETALTYRDERRQQMGSWTGEEPENFVLAGLVAVEDPGLISLPTHRLVRPPALPADLISRLARYFQIDDTTPKSYDGMALLRLLARVTAAGAAGTAFGALGLEESRLHLLTLAGAAGARALMPAGSPAWQSLDVNVLEYAVLRDALGVDPAAPGVLDYTEDAGRALAEVEAGRWPLAFLLNATKVDQILAVADAGERMPRKSTYFYPKLPTGLVLYPFE